VEMQIHTDSKGRLWMTSHYGPTIVWSVPEIPFHVNNNSNNNQIYTAPHGRNFWGAEYVCM